MTCPPLTGFVPKYGRLYVGPWAPGNIWGGAAAATKSGKSGTGLFGDFPLLEILCEGGVWRERPGAFRLKQE